MTNLEWIKAMSVDEMADAIYPLDVADKLGFCQDASVCDKLLDLGQTIPDDMCKECLRVWLESEVSE